jgi:hypothetical protein
MPQLLGELDAHFTLQDLRLILGIQIVEQLSEALDCDLGQMMTVALYGFPSPAVSTSIVTPKP